MIYTVHNAEFTQWAFFENTKYHAVLCDPPYGIAFMGKKWDDLGGPGAFQAQVTCWGEALKPLLYPGALVFMFGGTRMWHRMAAGMEDAGFQVWDTMMWLHGQGFPKGQDVSKLIDKQLGENFVSSVWVGYKTPQLKPAWEPILCFRIPSKKKYAELALEHGSGALNVDGSRIGTELVGWGGAGREQGRTYEGGWGVGEARPVEGRYPANVALECTCEETTTVETTETCKADEDGDTPNYKNKVYGKGMGGVKWTGTRPVTIVVHTNPDCPAFTLGEPSRFFYVAKASRSEREAGLGDEFVEQNNMRVNAPRESEEVKVGNKLKNHHPTVKPIALNRWLATLLLPPESVEPRRILVPFAGAGSEMIGCLRAGWDEVVGVELMEDYCKIAEARLSHWTGTTDTLRKGK